MNHLYRARDLSGQCMPWVKVRIEKLPKRVIGEVDSIGISKSNEMKISENMVKWSDLKLKNIVFHELAHKYLGAKHISDKKNIMYPDYIELPASKVEKDFIALAKKNKKCKVK
jgi:hypothetical protein